MLYGVWYGLERAVVEGMRTDSLYIGDTTLRVSQLLSMIIAAVFAAALIVCFVKLKKGTLWKGLQLNTVDTATDLKKTVEETETNKNMNKKTEIKNGTDN